MNVLRGALIAGLSLASLVVVSPGAMAATVSAADADGTPHLLTELLFNSTTSTGTTVSGSTTPVSMVSTAVNSAGWSLGARNGASLSVASTPSPISTADGVDALEGSFPVAGAGSWYVYANYSVASLNTEDVYIEFWATMPGAKEGCKFVKVFGDKTTTTGNANTTIFTNYSGGDYGSIYEVTFGDGTNLTNDSQNSIHLDGTDPQGIGRSYGTATVLTPQKTSFSSTDWGTGWHHFRIHIKFNSGTTSLNEVPDGEYYLEIDGKVYADATGLYNRNPANGPINSVDFFGWAQKDPEAFQLSYYDIRISTGGFVSQPLPDPPSNVGVK